jgi:hypothetical protein
LRWKNLVCFIAIWYIFGPLSILFGHLFFVWFWYIFPFCTKTNPATLALNRKLKCRNMYRRKTWQEWNRNNETERREKEEERFAVSFDRHHSLLKFTAGSICIKWHLHQINWIRNLNESGENVCLLWF